jgi:hypothetical protein
VMQTARMVAREEERRGPGLIQTARKVARKTAAGASVRPLMGSLPGTHRGGDAGAASGGGAGGDGGAGGKAAQPQVGSGLAKGGPALLRPSLLALALG